MHENFILGQFYPGDTLLHRLDPRAKLICLFLLMTGIILVKTDLGRIINALILLFLFYLAKLPKEAYIRALRPFIYIITATAFVQILLTPGTALIQLGPLAITREGLTAAATFSYRFGLLLVFSLLLTATTSPLALAKGLERILKPLGRLGFPAQETALMVSLALRFIPTLMEEGEKIRKAQEARGAVFNRGSLGKRMIALASLAIPLLVKVFRRADDLALAMEARCYGTGSRTSLRELRMSPRDWSALGLCGGALVLILALRAGVF